MKTSKLFLVLAIALTAFASCSKNNDGIDETVNSTIDEKSAEVTALCGNCDFTGTLTKAEIAGLMEMREEEKLAREVYLFLKDKYNYRVFVNIAKSENAHTSAVLRILKGFGLTDPSPVAATEFSNPLFTDLYAQLTKKGSVSLVEALKVGAFIEERDIADLQRHLAETKNTTVAKVYGNLLRASKFHLKAFTNALKFQGATYTPTVLSVEEYNKILGI